jgi:hypothetical protein
MVRSLNLLNIGTLEKSVFRDYTIISWFILLSNDSCHAVLNIKRLRSLMHCDRGF